MAGSSRRSTKLSKATRRYTIRGLVRFGDLCDTALKDTRVAATGFASRFSKSAVTSLVGREHHDTGGGQFVAAKNADGVVGIDELPLSVR